MTTPYAPPATAEPSREGPAPRGHIAFLIFGAIALVGALILGLLGSFVVPEFARVFESFGADLPAITLLIVRLHGLYWLPLVPTLALLVGGLLSARHGSPRRGFTLALAALCSTNILLLLVSVWALYLPIFKLAAVS